MFIVVRIKMETIPGVATLFPVDNYLGTLILARVLTLALEKAGVLRECAFGIGPLNDSHFRANVTDHRAALLTVKTELANLNLLRGATLAYYDPAELIFRVAYPQTGEVFEELPDISPIRQATHDFLQRVLEDNLKAMLPPTPKAQPSQSPE